ncbi:hypothetical protein SDRG_14810 [Saprolegnia diclina VS20]|uniref:Uncharacterized protein n=1 Tax=Saprolegnia diclina (strain VS20) TaxID=1156394 RepID=T0R5N4_SAPDV|nr:hypothetical protein SDRG_14810 [Saprolegnia diclina VS20]EQC27368.1 hypothetical protein SDRG_14810 [Saprolegnia diclina VS20]|eukprot:XP_008619187.1 hypothetical protein SDRG_14810 [Saprolegnia diclina VS20]
MPAWCQRDHCRRYAKHNGMCLYHARDVQTQRSSRPSLASPATTTSDASASPIATAQPPPATSAPTTKGRRPDARWSAIARIRYHHTGWIKCLVPTCTSEAKRHFPFCPMHDQSTLCVHETTKQYLQPHDAPTTSTTSIKEEAVAPIAS